MSVTDLDYFSKDEQREIEAELDTGFKVIEEKYAVTAQKGFETMLVVDNIPVVDDSKKQRLLERLRQTFAKVGAPIEVESIDMPWNAATGTNKGFIFLTYPDVKEAENAIHALDGVSFGKSVLHVNRFGDIQRFASMPIGESDLPSGWKEKEYIEKDYLRNWLGDLAGRDQYVTFWDAEVTVWWNGRNGTAEALKGSDGKPLKNNKWGELYLQWSTMGTYLASLHRVGVALWSGPKLDGPIGVNVLRFTHPNVRLVQFSPCENYLVTWSEDPLPNYENHPNAALRDTFGPEDEGNQYVIWDIKTTRVLRTFPGDKSAFGADDSQSRLSWPAFKWSADDSYIAKCNVGAGISVYELPTMGLLDKKSIKIEGVQDFEWCPMSQKDLIARQEGKGKECVLAFWTPEAQNQPARVNIMAVPSRTILRSKNLFNVSECKFYWQSQGDFLCVKVDRHARKAKSKKATSCNLEIFRMREKDYPVEVLEFKDYVPQFAWEPSGTRFAIVLQTEANISSVSGVSTKYSIDFYQLDSKKGDFIAIKHLDSKMANTLVWSPKGRHIALATIGSSSKYDIEFWDLDFTIDERREAAELGANVTMLGTGEHYGITEIAWDPSGRYIATSASTWRQSPEPGFSIWDFKGQQLLHESRDRFKQFLWRPRPPTLLSKEQIKKVRKELRDYSRQFDEEDAAEENRGSAEKLAQRRREIGEWNAWRTRNNDRLVVEREKKGKSKAKIDVQGQEARVEEWVEELIDETEELSR
ncbi:eukaryotic translation initiation factor 3 subunit B [Cryptococcus deuterogattii 99/473]|uniref:Eukaryotic translation initiation factor 3 subunit B n=2 Tax=Cryptococcus gattii species complex TaxID=1884637 RepID=A0A0D0TYG3_9TREE|nr:eukaryotic translation initiation factor 3 subunit B [Cryptococcus deuterogattii MMRL2647]KIR40943.1 eukaryotic translation initiation factor 3 subunit B [Cryptococcus deuterogattii Ram5]KIR72300.1 eukaryotic translation initiation factor 3 subunit B [Cryptococcus deuterogattii CA1014]KIR97703.1 eukaryotic translation initiation factor 3 subunit B [Cryptococcus deuterogattii 2001/935-1]KIY54263.1 eukaryotic translation initiation factor 3 subunit B [Cryptococcus deuterogattii 99/473]